MKDSWFANNLRTIVAYVLGLLFVATMSSCGPEPPPEVITPGGNNGDTTIIDVTELPPLRIPADNPLSVAGVD
ncbi:MAG: hypothetical protein ACI8SE_001428 [Bacteroidia bacterium]|jgi:hypothetical protein